MDRDLNLGNNGARARVLNRIGWDFSWWHRLKPVI
jgi:hypothetical protein